MRGVLFAFCSLFLGAVADYQSFFRVFATHEGPNPNEFGPALFLSDFEYGRFREIMCKLDEVFCCLESEI
jgi:hypothetical protein